MSTNSRLLVIPLGSIALVATACTVEKKNSTTADSAAVETPAPATVTPQAAPAQAPTATATPPETPTPPKTAPAKSSRARSATESVKPFPKPPTKIKREPPVQEGGLRDSTIQPVMAIGADGKLHPIKK